MQDPPSSDVILELAQRGDMGAAHSKFEMKMNAAALELVKRATALAPASDAAERARLSALVGEAGDLDQLNRRLCALIRDGALDLASPGLATHLRATAMEKLAIDQPTYAAYRRALETNQG